MRQVHYQVFNDTLPFLAKARNNFKANKPEQTNAHSGI